MNKGFIKLSLLFAGALALVGVVGYLVSARNSDVSANNYDDCETGCPVKSFSASHYLSEARPSELVCPEGFTPYEDTCRKVSVEAHWGICPEGYEVDPENESQCRQWVEPVYSCPSVNWKYWWFGWHEFNVRYEKSEDPTKCHRPSDNDLKNVYGMSNWEKGEFKEDNSEWKDANIDVAGHYIYEDRPWIDTEYEYADKVTNWLDCPAEWEVDPEDETLCRQKETFETAVEYGKEGIFCVRPSAESQGIPEWALGAYSELPEKEDLVIISCPTPTPTETPTPTPTPEVDVCPNLEGNQSELPEGYVFDGQENCVLREEPTPTPSPEPQRETTPAGAPQCTDSTPLVLPSNVHVIRGDNSATPEVEGMDTATVNFFTSSSNANIYFKEVSASDWQHSARDIVVTGGYVSYVIRDLNPALGYTFGIQAANSCAGGETVVAVVVDGPASTTFPLNYWEWLN